MTKQLVLATCALMISASAFAGDNGGGTLSCASGSGRTTLTGGAGAPYNGSGSSSLTYSIDGRSVNLAADQYLGPEIHSVDFVEFTYAKSYSATVKISRLYSSKYVYSQTVLRLVSKPGTMKKIKNDVFAFVGVIPAYSTIDPRENSGLNAEDLKTFDKDIEVNCSLDVSL